MFRCVCKPAPSQTKNHAESTRRLVGNLFEVTPLGAMDLKATGEPVRAWAVLRASTVASRFEALHAGDLTALVGREEEIELLLRRWSRVKAAEGQVVLLSGEAGIGKSGLIAALLERITTDLHTRLLYFCSSHYADSALYPIISQIKRAAGFAPMTPSKRSLTSLMVCSPEPQPLSRARALCRDAVASERWSVSYTRSDPATAPTENAQRHSIARSKSSRGNVRC